MKKLLLLAMVVVASTSCIKKEYLDCDCDGDGLYMYSQDFEVENSDHWEFEQTQDEAYYYYTFRFDKLTETVCNIGSVTATRYVDGRQRPLEEVRYYENVFNGVPTRWAETVSMDYRPGEITFMVKYSDFNYANTPKPNPMAFRVALIW